MQKVRQSHQASFMQTPFKSIFANMNMNPDSVWQRSDVSHIYKIEGEVWLKKGEMFKVKPEKKRINYVKKCFIFRRLCYIILKVLMRRG